MKRAVIVHAWGAVPDSRWYQFVASELRRHDFAVEVPLMPDTDNPDYETWLAKLQATIGEPDENLYLIGHSLGAPLILRYLEHLTPAQQIGGVVMVAGFTADLMGRIEDSRLSFFKTAFAWDQIKERAKHFVAIQSDNDPYVPVTYGEFFRDKLGAREIILSGLGHISKSDDLDKYPDVTELPEVVSEVLSMTA